MDYDIQNDITIDQYHLEKECITMAGTYFRYADLAREAKSTVSEKSDLVKVITAERSIAIRESLTNDGVRITEGIMKSAVEADLDVRQAMKELREAEATYLRLSAAVAALEIKKSELDNLVKLRCNSYYVENASKPTADIASESQSMYNRHTMTPLPR